MFPVILTKIKTSDGVTLDGIYVHPVRGPRQWRGSLDNLSRLASNGVKPKQKNETALIWVHGLTSYFYSSQTLIRELSLLCGRNGIGYFKFNTRGHDLIVRGQDKSLLLGTLFEKFQDCVYDIRAMIRFAKRLGYHKIILAGHSTGANKIVYYLHQSRDRNVKGLILVAGLNDIVAEAKRVGKKEFTKALKLAQKLNLKNPMEFFMSKGFLFTARRYLSLHTPGTPEDVFPYYDSKAGWKELKSIRAPMAVILGSRDENLDRPAQKLIGAFEKNAKLAKSFSGIIIKNANHGFYKKEKELAKEIINWIKIKG